MKGKRFMEEQIVGVLKEAAGRRPLATATEDATDFDPRPPQPAGEGDPEGADGCEGGGVARR